MYSRQSFSACRFFVCGGRKKTDIAEEKGVSPTAFDRICKEEMVSL